MNGLLKKLTHLPHRIRPAFIFIPGLLIFLLQYKLMPDLWLKYVFIIFFLLFSTYWFIYGFLFSWLKRQGDQWLLLSVSGLIMAVTAALLALFPHIPSANIANALKITGITHYIFACFQFFRYKEHSLALFHFLVALLISALVYL